MLHKELPERSHLVQPRQILLFGDARWTTSACTVVIDSYLHISYQETTSSPYLDNELAEQSAQSTVLEQSSGGEGSMGQRDCYSGSTQLSQLGNRLNKIKGSRTRHHEQPFEDRGEAVGEICQKEKGRWIEL